MRTSGRPNERANRPARQNKRAGWRNRPDGLEGREDRWVNVLLLRRLDRHLAWPIVRHPLHSRPRRGIGSDLLPGPDSNGRKRVTLRGQSNRVPSNVAEDLPPLLERQLNLPLQLRRGRATPPSLRTWVRLISCSNAPSPRHGHPPFAVAMAEFSSEFSPPPSGREDSLAHRTPNVKMFTTPMSQKPSFRYTEWPIAEDCRVPIR